MFPLCLLTVRSHTETRGRVTCHVVSTVTTAILSTVWSVFPERTLYIIIYKLNNAITRYNNKHVSWNEQRLFSLSLPYGSDTLVPPSHQYNCNSLPGPLYTCHPHSCLDSVCHSIVRTYHSFYSLCFRKKRNWKIDSFIFPTPRWRLGIRPRKTP